MILKLKVKTFDFSENKVTLCTGLQFSDVKPINYIVLEFRCSPVDSL